MSRFLSVMGNGMFWAEEHWKQEESLSEKLTFSHTTWDVPNINGWYEDPKKAQP